MEPPLTLTERIVYLKKCAGSLRRLDKAAGLKPGYCHALVARIDNPHLLTLHKIADGTGVARSWVTNGDGPLPSAEGIRSAVAAACADAPDEDEADADEAAPPVFSGTPSVSVITDEEKARLRARLAERLALDAAEAAKKRVA